MRLLPIMGLAALVATGPAWAATGSVPHTAPQHDAMQQGAMQPGISQQGLGAHGGMPHGAAGTSAVPHTATQHEATQQGAMQPATAQPGITPPAAAPQARTPAAERNQDFTRAEQRWARPAPRPTRVEDRAFMGGGMILEDGQPVPLSTDTGPALPPVPLGTPTPTN